MEKIAIVKISAQTIKLSLVDVAPNGLYNLFDEVVETIKIGQSIDEVGLIKTTVVSEALTILKLFRKICDANNVYKITAVAESFIKSAKNQKGFFDEIYNNTGFNFYIYNTEEEVKLIYKGISNLIDVSKAVGIYIAPTQTHIMQFNRRTITNVFTMDCGYLTLADKYVDELDVNKKCAKMVKDVSLMLKDNAFLDNIEPEITFIGAGGIFESLGKLARKATKYPLNIENNYVLTKEIFDSVYNLTIGLDLDKTKKLKGILDDRADTLASGFSIIKAIMDACGIQNLSIASGAFDEGMVLNALPVDTNDKMIPSDMLSMSLESIRTFYDRELSNTTNVYNLAILLFKQLKVVHKLPRAYIKPLRIAASMYNCGTRIGFNNYANNSFDIILNSKICGASQKEILLAGFACRAQNMDNLRLADWMRYSSILTEEDLDAVRKLGVLISLACAMDKSRMGNITDITCDILGDSIIMKTIVKADASFDIIQAQKIIPEFKRVFKKVLQVI